MDFTADCLPQIHVAAMHGESGYRSFTPGMGALCRKENILSFGGIYQNSHGKGSVYAGAGWQPKIHEIARAGVIAGFVTGYEPQPRPMAAFVLSVSHVHLSFIPKFEGRTPGTLGISFTFVMK